MKTELPSGHKDDAGKPKWYLLPFPQVQKIVDVLTYGEKKYSADNWKYVEKPRERYFSAAMRHITAWYAGEKNDPEDNLSHLAHACCCLLFLMWFDDEKEKTRLNYEKAARIRCECGKEFFSTLDIIESDTTGTGYECNGCHRTLLIIKPKS